MKCNSCRFEIGEKEKFKQCESCEAHTHTFCLIPKGEQLVCDVCLVRKVEEKKEYEFTLPEHIRRTNIETYRKCPNKFKLEVLEGKAQPPTHYTEVGIDLHDLFEKAVLDRSYQKHSMIHEYENVYLPRHRELGIYKLEDDEKNFTARAMACIETFYTLLPSIPKPFVTEETIFYEVSPELPKVRFTMDLITENNEGGLDLHDWKTGKELVGKQLASDMQAPIYIYGVEQHYGRRVDSFTFHYLKDGKTRRFERVREGVYVCKVLKREYIIRLDEMIKEIQRLFASIKGGDFNVPRDTKSMFFACKMCHLKEQGLCLGADQEIWTQINR